MRPRQRPITAVVLPGTGSDADFAARAFGRPLRELGVEVLAVEPDPQQVVASYVDALDDAVRRHGPIVAGGVSLGAAVALNWAFDHRTEVVAVLAALPPWTGSANDAPAALSAALTARQLRADGLAAVTAVMRGGSPRWLGDELAKSWQSQWPHLPQALDEAAAYRAPTVAGLMRTDTSVGIATAIDDPVHPSAVAEEWAKHLPHAGIGRLTLDDIGADAASLGYATLRGLESTGFRW